MFRKNNFMSILFESMGQLVTMTAIENLALAKPWRTESVNTYSTIESVFRGILLCDT